MDGRGTTDGVVHFRVASIVPNPLRQASVLDAFMLNVVYVNYPAGTTFGLSSLDYARCQRAIDKAIASQLVYWVDWSLKVGDSERPGEPRELDLLLRAIVGNQVVIDAPPHIAIETHREPVTA